MRRSRAASGGASTRSPSTTSPPTAGVSRATLYRLFPGGKDVLFDALRVRELDEFFTRAARRGRRCRRFEDLLVRTVVCATDELRADEHLALMLASEPGRDAEPAHRRRACRASSASPRVYLAPARRAVPRPASRGQVDRPARPTRHLVLPRPERPRRPRRRTLAPAAFLRPVIAASTAVVHHPTMTPTTT